MICSKWAARALGRIEEKTKSSRMNLRSDELEVEF